MGVDIYSCSGVAITATKLTNIVTEDNKELACRTLLRYTARILQTLEEDMSDGGLDEWDRHRKQTIAELMLSCFESLTVESTVDDLERLPQLRLVDAQRWVAHEVRPAHEGEQPVVQEELPELTHGWMAPVVGGHGFTGAVLLDVDHAEEPDRAAAFHRRVLGLQPVHLAPHHAFQARRVLDHPLFQQHVDDRLRRRERERVRVVGQAPPEHMIFEVVRDGLAELATENNLPLSFSAHPALTQYRFDHPHQAAIQTLWTVRMLERGFLTAGLFCPMLSHESSHVSAFLNACEPVFFEISQAIKDQSLEQRIGGPVKHTGFTRLA